MRRARPRKVSTLLVAVALVGLTSPARAEGDLALDSEAWNGLAQFVGLGHDLGIEVLTPNAMPLDELEPNDAIIWINPTRALPRASLLAFLEDGGRLVVADDYAEGGDFLQALGVHRHALRETDAPRAREDDALPVAVRRGIHPLTEGVSGVVANRPAEAQHRDLEPILAFDQTEQDGLVIAGGVAEGRLVVLADPSVLINDMLGFSGNQRFAENLYRYMESDRGGKVYALSGDAGFSGRYRDVVGDRPYDSVARALEAGLRYRPPSDLLRIAAGTLFLALMFLATSLVARRTPYLRRALIPDERGGGGLRELVAIFARPGAQLLHPALRYRAQLQEDLVTRLGLPPESSRGALLKALPSAAARGRAQPLFEALDRLAEGARDTHDAPRVDARMLAAWVAQGDALLASLDAPVSPRASS